WGRSVMPCMTWVGGIGGICSFRLTGSGMATWFEKLKTKKSAEAGALGFMRVDYWSTLFPLKTYQIVADFNKQGVSSHIYEKILADGIEESFLSQQRVYATKSRGHLRRTVKLDPVAEYFIYDLVYRNRN